MYTSTFGKDFPVNVLKGIYVAYNYTWESQIDGLLGHIWNIFGWPTNEKVSHSKYFD